MPTRRPWRVEATQASRLSLRPRRLPISKPNCHTRRPTAPGRNLRLQIHKKPVEECSGTGSWALRASFLGNKCNCEVAGGSVSSATARCGAPLLAVAADKLLEARVGAQR